MGSRERIRKVVKRHKANKGNINRLGEDLLVEILSKLPTKSLLRCRSVSKSWSCLTRKKYFIRRHMANLNSDNHHYRILLHTHTKQVYVNNKNSKYVKSEYSLSLLRKENEKTLKLNIPFLPDHVPRELCWFVLCGSSNGIVCVSYNVSVGENECPVILWNPATGKYRKLPTPNPEDSNISSKNANGAHNLLIGLDFIHQDSFEYKVAKVFCDVSINNGRHRAIFLAQAFVETSNSWRPVKNKFEIESDLRVFSYCGTSVTVNGVLYWKIQRGDGGNRRLSIMSFDLHTEVFTEIQIPTDLNNQLNIWNHTRLYSWNNSLVTTAVYHHQGDYHLYCWNMSTNNNNPVWNIQFKVKYSVFPGKVCQIGIWKNRLILGSTHGNDNDKVTDLKYYRHLFGYDPKTKITRKILKDGEMVDIGFGISNYVETLAPV